MEIVALSWFYWEGNPGTEMVMNLPLLYFPRFERIQWSRGGWTEADTSFLQTHKESGVPHYQNLGRLSTPTLILQMGAWNFKERTIK